MEINGLDEKMQSAYKCGRVTETALLRVKTTFLWLSTIGGSGLVLLDLSAAFDTVDRAVILHRLELLLGLRRKPLAWFRSHHDSQIIE